MLIACRDFDRAGRFRIRLCRPRSSVPSNRSFRESEPMEAIAEPLEVLLDTELYHLGAVPDLAQVRVSPPDHLLAAMPELATRCTGSRARRGPRLQPRRAAGVV